MGALIEGIRGNLKGKRGGKGERGLGRGKGASLIEEIAIGESSEGFDLVQGDEEIAIGESFEGFERVYG